MTDGGFVDLTSFMFGGVAAESVGTDAYVPISYPIDIPSVSGVVSVTWAREEVRAISESPFTLNRQVFRHQGERWRVGIVLPKMRKEHAGQWRGLLLMLDGGYGSFWFGDYFNPTPKGLAWGAPKVDGSANSGRVLTTIGWTENVTGILKAGDKIQVGSYLYEVLRDANTDIDGKATLDIFPRLRATPSSGDTIITNSPRGLFRLSNPGGALSTFDLSGAVDMPSFEIVEAI